MHGVVLERGDRSRTAGSTGDECWAELEAELLGTVFAGGDAEERLHQRESSVSRLQHFLEPADVWSGERPSPNCVAREASITVYFYPEVNQA